MSADISISQTKLWDSYRNMYDQIQSTGGDAKLHKQLFDVGAAMIDEDYQLAVELAEVLRDQTIQPGQVTLGWIPTLCAKELLIEIEVMRDAA